MPRAQTIWETVPYRHLPERGVKSHLWQELAVDLKGPWAVKIRGKWYEFNALTCIDMVTNLVKIIGVDRTIGTPLHIYQILNNLG